MSSREGDVALAHELCTIATGVALEHFTRDIDVAHKPDGSAVTTADVAVERAMIDYLRRHRPDDGILSEEAGQLGTGHRRWILDPIDGTAGFIAGNDHWGTHVALEIDSMLVVSIITRPTLGRRWWAAAGSGAHASHDLDPLDHTARLSLGRHPTLQGARLGLLTQQTPTQMPALLESQGASVTVATPDHSVILDLLEGRLDAVVSENARTPWDHAPAQLLTVEAGGALTDAHGGVDPDLPPLIYGNGLIDTDIRRVL